MLIVIDTNNRPPYWNWEGANEWTIVFGTFQNIEHAIMYCNTRPFYHSVKDKELLDLFPMLTEEKYIAYDEYKKEDEIIFVGKNPEIGWTHAEPWYRPKYVPSPKIKYLQVFNGVVYNESVDVRTVAQSDFKFLPVKW